MLSFIKRNFSRSRFKRNTLRKNIHNYISKKKDICCEEDIDREVVIRSLFELYSHGISDPLETIHNDFSKFIGYQTKLKAANDKQGLDLWNQLDKSAFRKNELNREELESSLREVPLYYLLSFLGYGYYKFKDDIQIATPETPVLHSEDNSPPPSMEESTPPMETASKTPKI